MKTESTPEEKIGYRYLKEKDIENPHYSIVSFFCEEYLETIRFGMIDLIKTACSDHYHGDKNRYHYHQQQFVKLLELAHVLNDSQEDFKLSPDHSLFREDDHPLGWYKETNKTLFKTIHFRTLLASEANDVRQLLQAVFKYRSLDAWTKILDSFLACTHGKLRLDEIYSRKLYETVLIREYIEKVIEVMGLVYEIKSLPYVHLHHPEDFRMDEEPEEQSPIPNLTSLTKFAEQNFPAVINFIADVIMPEKIYCLSHEKGNDGTDHANLVLVIPERHPQTFEEIESTFNFACLKHHHLSCTLFKSSFFHTMIKEGHVYFSLACNTGSLIYDDGSKPIPKLRLDSRPEKIEKTKRDFYAGLAKAKTFYANAESYRNSNLNMAAFMLHQAVELCLRALGKSLSNQDKTTHGLSTLLKFSRRITPKLAILMDNGNAEDERLLILLEGAYLGYRYSEKYSIEKKDLNTLLEKVKKLHLYTEETFLDWMDKYNNLIS
jgi:HEPN domain-containing protein